MNPLDALVDDIFENNAKPREALVTQLTARQEELSEEYKRATTYVDLLENGIKQLTSLIEQLEVPPL